MGRTTRCTGLVLCTALSLLFTGCGGPAISPAAASKMEKVDDLIKSSGGSWDKLSQSDRDYLIQKIGKGSPVSAQMTFRIRANMLRRAH